MENKLAVIVGHSQAAQGATIAAPLNSTEYMFNKDVAMSVFRHARSAGLDCRIFLRDGKSIGQLYSEVNTWCDSGPAVAVELHVNSATKDSAYGTEVLIDREPADSQALAECLLIELYPLFNREGKGRRGIKVVGEGDRGHHNLSCCRHVAAIIEPVFGNNPNEAKLLRDKQFAYAEAIVKGVFLFYNQAAH